MDNAQHYQVHCTQILQYRITVLKFDMAIEGEKGDNTLNMVKVDIQVELKTISIIEPRHEKTGFSPMRKQRRRSASQ